MANHLVVSVYPNENQESFCFFVNEKDNLTIDYTHSVQKTPVKEIFKFSKDNRLIMYKTIYQSYGVGLPYLPTEGKFEQKDDGKFILYMNRPFNSIPLRTGLEAKPKLYHNNVEYKVYSIYNPGTLLIIKEEKFYEYLITKMKGMSPNGR
jgi:hypothetical protein